MSGYVFAVGDCVACGAVFSFAPSLVPSITYKGTRRPICRACVERVNPMRADRGLPPIVPLAGAYEPQPEAAIDDGL